ncbi:hypothetical protein DesLBE_0322 [Desulfitobacterium sp. LBE]|uniref:DUF4878 domain-containing protein n=5 Tax=root TaxID=1 RepID=Q24WD3_DESHY|nr:MULTISPECIES: hypothetical protein [Desulfitobacterium]ACL21049.1 hypothetical protein Dhaf_3026 [Desulfitobacterium hafniense DCB-2]EHL07003.1 hypothetical protein HMPREF0322_02288 [Desulfitobacterium hafniense DP7]KTE91316.1 hypothetical protein AT727_06905 [Desulfitobacterium hafniense]MEA5025869.1 hypothetical protein [Desulfitobacterium hafniense]TWH56132.1 hypothetical protein DesLBE_0322 [Desulfitobacterium sp. LBE]
MARSRYVWIMGITLVCLLGIVAWKSPQSVMVSLTQPHYADSPQAAVQRFWGYLDTRQLELAEQLLMAKELNPLGQQEFELWKAQVKNNPLISLKKMELADSPQPNSVLVNVEWTSPAKEKIVQTYVMETQATSEGWKIIQIQKLDVQSLALQ